MAGKARGQNTAQVGALVEGILQRAGLARRAKQYRILLEWREIVGEANARHSEPVAVKDGVLIVECSSAAWAQTLTMLRAQILEKIAKEMGECPLRDIHFRGLGKSRREAAPGKAQNAPPEKIELKVEQTQWIRETTAEISDAGLRRQAEEALGSLLRQRLWHERRGRRLCASCGRLSRGPGGLCAACRAARQA